MSTTSVIRQQGESQNGGNISYPPDMHTYVTYQGVRNNSFSENLACFVVLLPPFWDSPFCIVTDKWNNIRSIIMLKTFGDVSTHFISLFFFTNSPFYEILIWQLSAANSSHWWFNFTKSIKNLISLCRWSSKIISLTSMTSFTITLDKFLCITLKKQI